MRISLVARWQRRAVNESSNWQLETMPSTTKPHLVCSTLVRARTKQQLHHLGVPADGCPYQSRQAILQ